MFNNPYEIIKTHDIEKMKNILDNGFNVNKKGFIKGTLIEEAMKEQIFNMVNLLYQYNSDINRIKDLYNDVFFFDRPIEMDNKLFELTVNAINEFSITYPDEEIYAFGFEYRYEYASVIISMNSVSDFNKTLKYYQDKYPEEYKEQEKIDDLKYNPGDWKYQNYKSYTIIVKGSESDYTDSLKHVLDRLEKEKSFTKLKISKDFQFQIYDYD